MFTFVGLLFGEWIFGNRSNLKSLYLAPDLQVSQKYKFCFILHVLSLIHMSYLHHDS